MLLNTIKLHKLLTWRSTKQIGPHWTKNSFMKSLFWSRVHIFLLRCMSSIQNLDTSQTWCRNERNWRWQWRIRGDTGNDYDESPLGGWMMKSAGRARGTGRGNCCPDPGDRQPQTTAVQRWYTTAVAVLVAQVAVRIRTPHPFSLRPWPRLTWARLERRWHSKYMNSKQLAYNKVGCSSWHRLWAPESECAIKWFWVFSFVLNQGH